MKVALIVVAASVLLVSGCSSMFAADPTAARPSVVSVASAAPTPTSAPRPCSPKTAAFRWEKLDSPIQSFEAVSVSVKRYGTHADSFSSNGIDGGFDLGSNDSSPVARHLSNWTPAITASLARSKVAPSNFARVSAVVDSSPFSPPMPHTGKWIRVVVAPALSFRVTVDCGGGSTVITVGGAVPENVHEFTIHCDKATHSFANAQRNFARNQCKLYS